MTRSIRRLEWRAVLMSVLLVLLGPTLAMAQNTFPASGNVGIGTTGPGQRLQVVGGQFGLFGSATGSGLSIVGGADGTAVQLYADYLGATQPALHLSTFADRAGANGVTIQSGGNVGIGTMSPGARLHVAGDVQVDGNVAAKYQDVAEWVQAPIAVPPGVVLVVDPRARNQVLPASEPYDTRVAGVVSSRPGLLLGEAGEGKVKVAHSGRVKVKVDASYGPIAAGDLLVTSPTSGYAMRSVPIEFGGTLIHRPGTVLGKALEPLERGQDEILVLLTLQ